MQKTTQRAVLVATILAVSMTTIDQTIVAICSPQIQSSLGISHDAMQWAVNAYILATAATFAFGGRVADIVGQKKMTVIGISGFAFSSLLCSLAPHGNVGAAWLVVSRVLQGVSGGLMFPAALGIVIATFDKERRGSAMASFFAVTGAMTAVGPVLGGYLSDITWRSIFWINLPIALVALLVLAPLSLPAARSRAAIDWRGAAMIATGMTLLILGLQQSSTWEVLPAIGCAVLGAAVLAAAVVVEWGTKDALVNVGFFLDRGFTASALAVTFASIAFIPVFFFMSVYAQVSLGDNASETGLLMLKFFIGFVIASRLGSQLFDSHGARLPLLVGGLLGAGGFVWWASVLTELHPGTGFFNDQFWPIALSGAGIGYMLAAASTDGVNRADAGSYSQVTGVFQTLRNFGAALGMAAMAAVVDARLDQFLTASFHRLGAPASAAHQAAAQISGADAAAGAGDSAPHLFVVAVQLGYAQAAQWAFYLMAAAMMGVALMALVHPGEYTGQTVEGGDRNDHELTHQA